MEGGGVVLSAVSVGAVEDRGGEVGVFRVGWFGRWDGRCDGYGDNGTVDYWEEKKQEHNFS